MLPYIICITFNGKCLHDCFDRHDRDITLSMSRLKHKLLNHLANKPNTTSSIVKRRNLIKYNEAKLVIYSYK